MNIGSITASLALWLSLVPTLPAQEPDLPPEPEETVASTGTIPVKIVGGRLVAHVELSTIHNRVPANLFIEFDNPCGLRLHNAIARALKAENEAGEEFGRDRLAHAVLGARARPTSEVVTAVRDEWTRFRGDVEPTDDTTVIALRRTPPS